MQAPDAVVELAGNTIARRQIRAAVLLVLTLVLVVLSSVWYLERRTANDRLLTAGRVVLATISDVDRSSRGPDTMTVSFVVDGESVSAEIHSGWFTGFRRAAVGGSVRVLVDQQDPTFVRLPESRNINQWTRLSVVAAALAAVLSFLYFRQQRGFAALLDHGTWGRRTIRLRKPGAYWKALVRAESALANQEIWVDAGIAGGTRGITAGEWATWSCENGRSLLLVIDETGQVITVARLNPHLPKGDLDGIPVDR